MARFSRFRQPAIRLGAFSRKHTTDLVVNNWQGESWVGDSGKMSVNKTCYHYLIFMAEYVVRY